MNKTGLVNEVKDRLGVSTAKAKTVVDAVFDELGAALAKGEAITLRGFGFTPESDKNWAAATDSVKAPAKSSNKSSSAKSSSAKATAAKSAEARAKTSAASRPVEVVPATEPQLVPYEPMHDPAADALAAVAAEQARPQMTSDPYDQSTRVVATMPEPELLAEPDTLAYTSGDADPDETIGERTGETT